MEEKVEEKKVSRKRSFSEINDDGDEEISIIDDNIIITEPPIITQPPRKKRQGSTDCTPRAER